MNLPIYQLRELLPPVGEVHWNTLDSTKLQSFSQCPRQYFLEYVLGWRSSSPSNHLIFGQAWHSALEYLYSHKDFSTQAEAEAFKRFLQVYRAEFSEDTDSWFGGKTPEAALSALVEYCSQNASDLYDYTTLATEVYDHYDLHGDGSQTIVVKLDAVLQDNKTGQICIMEHKTGSSSGQYWALQWHLSLQVGAYIAACNRAYNQEETPCIVDGTFFLKTKRNFQREIVTRSQESMLNWYNTVTSLISRIQANFELLANYDRPTHTIQKSFPQNPCACSNYAGCQFHDICTCSPNPLALWENSHRQPPMGFKEYWWNPLATAETSKEGEE